MAVAFDTLRTAETLRSSRLPEEQAKAQAKALSDARKEGMGTLATKEDLAETRRALEASTKEDLVESKQEIKAEIADIRGDIKLLRCDVCGPIWVFPGSAKSQPARDEARQGPEEYDFDPGTRPTDAITGNGDAAEGRFGLDADGP